MDPAALISPEQALNNAQDILRKHAFRLRFWGNSLALRQSTTCRSTAPIR
jgi:hypothetical protein